MICFALVFSFIPRISLTANVKFPKGSDCSPPEKIIYQWDGGDGLDLSDLKTNGRGLRIPKNTLPAGKVISEI